MTIPPRLKHGINWTVAITLIVEVVTLYLRFGRVRPQDIDLRWPGYLFLLDNQHDVAVFRHNVAMQNGLGIPSAILSTEEVGRRVPLLNLEGVLAGAWHAG